MRRGHRSRGEEGAALILAVLTIAILTMLALSLLYVTGMELRLAANDGNVSKAFHAADTGIQWVAAELIQVGPFLGRPEFSNPDPALQYTEFTLQDHSPRENAAAPNITVRIEKPKLLGRRSFPGGSLNSGRAQYLYDYSVLSQSRDNVLNANRSIQADIEVGPLPDTAPGGTP